MTKQSLIIITLSTFIIFSSLLSIGICISTQDPLYELEMRINDTEDKIDAAEDNITAVEDKINENESEIDELLWRLK